MNRISEYFEKELRENGHYEEVSSLNAYVGDIHNHCAISYGYGSIESAIAFARNQLDFFSVTGHFAWPDMEDKSMMIPEDVIAYHKQGFSRLRKNWPHYKECMKNVTTNSFIPFLSYEYHSFKYGDYTILAKDIDAELPSTVDEGEEDRRLDILLSGGIDQQDELLCTPHHIGYKTGYRGINWQYFNENVSPLVEIASMHGCAESFETRLKYLHTMGPRCGQNTYQGGLEQGFHFGVVGSTDHHNAAPGSYGSGRTVLYAKELTRDSIWNALRNRDTSCATGDPIETVLYVNGTKAGRIANISNGTLEIEAYVSSFDKLEKVEVIQDGKAIVGRYDFEADDSNSYSGFVSFMFGWGKKHKKAIWDIEVSIENGTLLDSSPRIRGVDMVDPLDVPADTMAPKYSFEDGKVRLHVATDGNTTAQSDCTNGFVLDIDGNDKSVLVCKAIVEWDDNKIEKEYRFPVTLLKEEERSEYIHGFVSPAIEVGKFRQRKECNAYIHERINTNSNGSVYLRAYEKNGDAVYTSPVTFR